jgi:hypothetical protein
MTMPSSGSAEPVTLPPCSSVLFEHRNAVLTQRIADAYEAQPGVFAAIGVLCMIGPTV